MHARNGKIKTVAFSARNEELGAIASMHIDKNIGKYFNKM
jgi:hypothetical protein